MLHIECLLIGVATMANKKALFITLVECIPHTEASTVHESVYKLDELSINILFAR
jgi:hypothetical protein